MFSGLLGSLLKNVAVTAVILGVMFFLHKNGQHWENSYKQLQAELAQQTAVKQAEIAAAKKQADKEAVAEHKKYVEQLGAILGTVETLGEKNENLQAVVDSVTVERNKLRKQIASIASTLSEREASIEPATEVRGNLDTAPAGCKDEYELINKLYIGCTDTTAAYNKLRNEFDRNCELTGCE